MTRVTAFVRPHRLEDVKTAIAECGISGMTVGDVRGRGNSPEQPLRFGSDATVIDLPIKAMVMVVVPDDLVEQIVLAILTHAHTGEHGDGKIFLEPVLDGLRIRTLERGESAV